MNDIDKKIAEKVKEIELLHKEKEAEELRVEIEKLKKTVVEETVINRTIVIENAPQFPSWPSQTWPLVGWPSNYYQITC